MATASVTVTRARDLLARHGLRPRKGLGQHFLVDPNTVRKIVRLADIRPDDTVLEIGPGLGSLTVGLADVAARVVALEVDARMAGALSEVVGSLPNVDVLIGDAMHTDLAALCGGPARLVSNLPYNLATPIVARVLDDVPSVGAGLVMVQREIGRRWSAPPGSKTYGAISVKVAFHAVAEVVATVPPTVFLPPPKVGSVLVAFRRREEPPVDVADRDSFFAFVEAAFGHRRKTLRNTLAAAGWDRDAAERALLAAEVDPGGRPEQLDLDAFARVYRELAA